MDSVLLQSRTCVCYRVSHPVTFDHGNINHTLMPRNRGRNQCCGTFEKFSTYHRRTSMRIALVRTESFTAC